MSMPDVCHLHIVNGTVPEECRANTMAGLSGDDITCTRMVDRVVEQIGEHLMSDVLENSGPMGNWTTKPDGSYGYSCGFDFRNRKLKEALRAENWDAPTVDYSGSMEWLKSGDHLPFRVKGESYWFYSDIPVRSHELMIVKKAEMKLPEGCSIVQVHEHKPYASHLHIACKEPAPLNTLAEVIGMLLREASD